MTKFHTKPDVSETREAISRINDHLGRSIAIVHTWGNGEGISIELNDEDKKGSYVKEQRIELHWSQWRAIVACVKSLMKGGRIMSPVEQVIVSLASRCARLAIELEDAQRRLRQEESDREFAEGVSSERYDAVVQELNALRSANQALAGTNSRFLTEINTLRGQIQQQKGVE